jgi:alpha,alpha-trehalase
MLGLAESGHWDNVEDMVTNFAAEIDAWATSPTVIVATISSRSQPPFFSFMVELLATHDGDRVLKTWLPQMEKSTSTGCKAPMRWSREKPTSGWCVWRMARC